MQTISGSFLEGNGTLITETFDTAIALPTQNSFTIFNTGSSTYITVEVEDGTTAYFSTGSKATVAPFAAGTSAGTTSKSGTVSLSGSPDNSVWSWSRGKVKYNFIATSTSPLPADKIDYLSKDNEYREHTFYCEWSATAGTLGTNLVGKINEVQVDGLDEFSAAFSAFGLFYCETTVGTAKFNSMPIYRNGAVFTTMDDLGRNPYPIAGGEIVNKHVKNVNTPYIPFVADKTKLSIIVPNTDTLNNNQMIIAFAATAGTLTPNLFRMRAAGSGAHIKVEVNGQ